MYVCSFSASMDFFPLANLLHTRITIDDFPSTFHSVVSCGASFSLCFGTVLFSLIILLPYKSCTYSTYITTYIQTYLYMHDKSRFSSCSHTYIPGVEEPIVIGSKDLRCSPIDDKTNEGTQKNLHLVLVTTVKARWWLDEEIPFFLVVLGACPTPPDDKIPILFHCQ